MRGHLDGAVQKPVVGGVSGWMIGQLHQRVSGQVKESAREAKRRASVGLW